MSGESKLPIRVPSTFRDGKIAIKKSSVIGTSISFRDLAKLASRRKTERFLADRTGCDERTAARWLSGESRAPATALRLVVVDILSRVEL